MSMTRRHFHRTALTAGAAAAIGMFGRTAAFGASASGYRAMVGVFLFGGNDGWNMVVPTDPATYGAYLASRGTVALAPGSLAPLAGSGYALHGAMAPLASKWDQNALSLVLNTGTLAVPLDKTTYAQRPDLRPTNLMSHSDEQEHWQGLRARSVSRDGFMGRLTDRIAASGGVPPLMSFAGNNVALIGQRAKSIVLPSTGSLTRSATSTSAVDQAFAAFSSGAGLGTLTESTAATYTDAYDMTRATATVLGQSSSVDAYFVDPDTGAALGSDLANQLKRVARMIEAHGTFGHARQSFFVSHGGYDTHDNQVTPGETGKGTHAALLRELAVCLAAFHNAMLALGLGDNVTAFTMSDFGRTYKGNAQYGCDHAWGSNHLVLGGGVTARGVFGRYPDPTLGGSDDISWEGRFLPTTSQEEYIGAILRWHGVSDADMGYVVPNWSTWSSNGRAPLALFA
ncbi:DUF1501 domain-containing protein [Sphingomonas sp. BK235]|uniref:DUF1501 domain-containing protein n=1 Tax=Sphingomonas sp. BK235 TaxID=2512131 RepID=UPI001051CE39|nr:DUF1501 domain-containing protein [Sphingomonas sp. BK235]TCP34077.1 uncharacterized protein (DUF1501 family) [Sphingomonas sp. BK235]